MDANTKLAEKRVEIQVIKAENMPLGQPTKVVRPEDIRVMFSAKMCELMLENEIRANNTLKAFLRSYGEVDQLLKEDLESQTTQFAEVFKVAKKRLTRVCEAHPLWKRFKGIRGLSAYQLGLIIGQIKDISRFEKPSALCVYAGVQAIKDPATGTSYAVTKGNINKIKTIYAAQGREFKGFNTKLAGRLLGVVVDCLMRARGWFYDYYTRERVRLLAHANSSGMIENVKGEPMMKGKKNMSAKLWTDRNAKRRMCRNLLYFIYAEWRDLEGLPVREPYPIEYQGHTTKITLDEVLAAGG